MGTFDSTPSSATTQPVISHLAVPEHSSIFPRTIPVGTGESAGPDLGVDAKATRINFKSNHNLDSGDKLSTFIEMDFYLSPGGNERVSNSYNPRLRHAFIKYNDWLFGQTWSTFQDVGVLPETMEFIGPSEGTTFMRQAMIRYTNGNWEFALENPETTITPNGGGGRIVADDGAMPDIVARYTIPLDGGHIKVAGLARQLDYDAGAIDDSETIVGAQHFRQAPNRRSPTIFAGWSRPVQVLAVTSVSTRQTVRSLTAPEISMRSIRPVSSWHIVMSGTRTGARMSFISALSINNDTALTGTGVTKDVYSAHVNLVYQPVPKLTLGGEVMFAEREIESGLDGDMTRFILSAKYAF